MPFVTIAARRIEYARIEVAESNRPTLVFLHEGLGSIAMWRAFPGDLARATNCNAAASLKAPLKLESAR